MQENEPQLRAAKNNFIIGLLIYAVAPAQNESHQKQGAFEWGLVLTVLVWLSLSRFPILQKWADIAISAALQKIHLQLSQVWRGFAKPLAFRPVTNNAERISAHRPPLLVIPPIAFIEINWSLQQRVNASQPPRPALPPYKLSLAQPAKLSEYRVQLIANKGEAIIEKIPHAKCQLMFTCMQYPVTVTHEKHQSRYDYYALKQHIESRLERSNRDPIMNVPLKDCKIKFDLALQEEIVKAGKAERKWGEFLFGFKRATDETGLSPGLA